MPQPHRHAEADRLRPERWLARRGGVVELLRVPALAFGLIARTRAGLYDRALLPRERLEVPVVSVGNLSAGGTGKSPCVVFLARRLRARGRRPGVLSRGYRARAADPRRENDESLALARELPDVPRVQRKDRVAGGRELIAAGCEVIVLDDGFQHRRLARDLDLVLVDALRPWGLAAPDGEEPVRELLPRGLLREPPAALRRADALVLTRSDQVAAARRDALVRELEALAPGRPVLLAEHRPRALRAPDGTLFSPEALAGREVDVVSGIGNPEAFEASVAGLGARIRARRRFPDHHAFAPEDLSGLGADGRWIVTTAKDAVKLDPPPPGLRTLLVDFALATGEPVLDALLDALPPADAARRRRALHEGMHG